MKGLILAGGNGTRLRPLTYSQQKQLIPVANKPILFYAIEDLLDCGVHDIGLVVGPNADQVRATVLAADWSKWGAVQFDFIRQESPLGLAHAVKISRDFLGDDAFVMYLGDNILKGGIQEHADRFQKGNLDALVLLTEVKDPRKFGVAVFDGTGRLTGLVEKPTKPPSNLALVGIYFFNGSIHGAIDEIRPSARNELEITDALQRMISMKRRVESARVSGWWKDTGLPEDMLDANALVLEDLKPENNATEVSEEAVVKGRNRIGAGTKILGHSVIRGPVIIGPDCVLEDAHIGPYTTLGPRVRVRATEIEHSIVLEGCELDGAGRVVESLIGRDVRIHARGGKPAGHRFVVGDNSEIRL